MKFTVKKLIRLVQRRLEKNVHWCIKTHAFLMDDLKPRLQEGQESEWFCVLSGGNLVSLFQTLIGRQQLCLFLYFWKHDFGFRFTGKHEIALPSSKAHWTGDLDKGASLSLEYTHFCYENPREGTCEMKPSGVLYDFFHITLLLLFSYAHSKL